MERYELEATWNGKEDVDYFYIVFSPLMYCSDF